jgi:hypothetical protein
MNIFIPSSVSVLVGAIGLWLQLGLFQKVKGTASALTYDML